MRPSTQVLERYDKYHASYIHAKSLENLLRLETSQNLALLNAVDLGKNKNKKTVLGPSSLLAVANYLESDVLEQVYGPTQSGLKLLKHLEERHQGKDVDIRELLEGIYVLIAVIKKVAIIVQANQKGADDDDDDDDDTEYKEDKENDAQVRQRIDRLAEQNRNALYWVRRLRDQCLRLKGCLDPNACPDDDEGRGPCRSFFCCLS